MAASPPGSQHEKPEPGAGQTLLAGALIFSLTIALFVERDVFTNPYALNDDVRNQAYWMARILDPELFPHDYIANYFTQPILVSPLLKSIYEGLAHWVSPFTLSQFLPFALVLLATTFLFKFSEKYQNALYAFWSCLVFNCSLWIFKNMAGGLSRAFIYPLLFFTLWQMTSRHWFWVFIGLMLSAFIYPPAFFLLLVLLLIETGYYVGKDGHFKARLITFLSGLAGSLTLLFVRSANNPLAETFGPLSSNQSTEVLRDFYTGGRIVLFPWGNLSQSWPVGLKLMGECLERLPHLYIIIPTVVFLILIAAYHRFLQPRWGALLIPGRIWRLLFSSAILYGLAWVFLFYLYVPERYLQYSFPLIPTFMVGALLYQTQQQGDWLKQRILPILIILTVGITALFWRDDLMDPKLQEKALFSYLKTAVPKPALIAAPPGLASHIPLYAFRSVFLSNEAYIPFHQTYFKTIKGRLKDWLSAYYSTDPRVLRQFIRQHHIDYLIVQTDDFSEKRLRGLAKRYYFAFEPAFFNQLKANRQSGYVLEAKAQKARVFQSNGIQVFQAQALLDERQ